MINIVGLGPSDYKYLTIEAVEIINNGYRNYLRTNRHKSIKYFEEKNIEYESFDYLYDSEDSFDEVYERVVDELLSLEKKYKTINYYVPGSPNVAEKTVKLLKKRSDNLNIVNAISFMDLSLGSVNTDAVDGLMFLDFDFDEFDIQRDKDILITQCYNEKILWDIYLKLSNIYSEDKEIYFLKDLGEEGQVVKKINLYELTKEKPNHQCSIFIKSDDSLSLNRIFRRIQNSNSASKEFETKRILKKINEISKGDSEDEIFDCLVLIISWIFANNLAGFYNFLDIFERINEKIPENSDF